MENDFDGNKSAGRADSLSSDDSAPEALPPVETTATPKKSRKRGAMAKIKTEGNSDAEKEPPTKKSKRAKAAREKTSIGGEDGTRKLAKVQPIASTYDELSPADKRLIKMKESGATGKELITMWERETGKVVKQSAQLHTRYKRIKDNISCVKPEHHQAFRDARTAALQQTEDEKKALDAKTWVLTASKMKEMGIMDDYNAIVLEKQWKKLEADLAPNSPNSGDGVIGVNEGNTGNAGNDERHLRPRK
ncbi:hypothetical protein NA57DRAFT_72882 [Rhizodiscina lignyota]|uniref:Uncharacterized protein n=1 Tax=Rhizodiscina lignyota TaxID=1504668 RepID=A0A9P4MDA0_9PEZI|nr:hypothetical protein NA57DRAFT_72882 [Rhizodiscina lignyota]